MKNLSLFIVGIIIGALVTYYFVFNSEISKNVSSTDPALFSKVSMKPKGIITSEQAKKLDNAFNDRHKLISDSIVKRPDNRSAWWSLEDVRNYLKHAETQTQELGYKMDGIRVYLGAYPDTKEKGGGYTTMFFIPTGMKALSKGSSIPFNFQNGGEDIPGGDGLNVGGLGDPPSASYPQ